MEDQFKINKNIILIVVDSLAQNKVASGSNLLKYCPNLRSLIENGTSFQRHYASSTCTQFSMPSLFRSSLPLDEPAYDFGIKFSRDTFVELISNSGYATACWTTMPVMSRYYGYHKGFDDYYELFDLSILLSHFKHNILKHYINSEASGDAEQLQQSWIRTIPSFFLHIGTQVLLRRPKRNAEFHYKNQSMVKKVGIYALALMEAIKISLQACFRPNTLNLKSIESSKFFLEIDKFCSETAKTTSKPQCEQITSMVTEWIKEKKNQKFFCYLHYSDLHPPFPKSFEHKSQQVQDFLQHEISNGSTRNQKSVAYDVALINLDEQIGNLLTCLVNSGLRDQTTIILTADHGSSLASPVIERELLKDAMLHFYEEIINVPCIISDTVTDNDCKLPLTATIDIAPTILELANLNPPAHYTGLSLLKKINRTHVIVEHSGRGPQKLGPLTYTCVVTDHKKIVVESSFKHGSREIEARRVFDLDFDNLELDENQNENDALDEICYAKARIKAISA